MRFDTRASWQLSAMLPPLLCAAMLAACHGGDDAAAPSPAVAANTVAVSVEEGTDLLAYVGQSKTVTLNFRTSDGAAATKLSVSLPAASGWQSQTGTLSCDTVAREGSCVLRLAYAPTQPAAAATLRLPYRYIDSAGASQGGSVTLNYRALGANAAVATVAPNPVPGVVGRQSTLTIDFATNDGTVAGALAASLALPAGWSSDAANFSCERFGGGAPCRLTLRYAPTQNAPSSGFTIGYSYVDSTGKPQADAVSVGYSAVAPNSVRVDVGGANLASPNLVIVEPGNSQDVSFTFTSSDSNALANLRLAANASLPAGWISDAPLSAFSCAEVVQDGKCQLVLHFRPAADGSQARQTLALNFTYRDAVGQSMSGSASIDYTSRIYRLYAAGTPAAFGVSQCWLKMADGATKYDLNACDDPGPDRASAVWRMIISGSKGYLLDGSGPVIRVCDLGADGALLDCPDQITVPSDTRSIAVTAGKLYLFAFSGGNSTLYVCSLNSNFGCASVNINPLGIKLSSVTTLASDGSHLYLFDRVERQFFQCIPSQDIVSSVQCEGVKFESLDSYTTMAAGQLGDASYAFFGLSGSDGVQILKCLAKTHECVTAGIVVKNPGLALIDLQFTYNTSAEPALYLLLVERNTLTRGVVRCTLANAKTPTNDIRDPVSCSDYTRFVPANLGNPSAIAVR